MKEIINEYCEMILEMITVTIFINTFIRIVESLVF